MSFLSRLRFTATLCAIVFLVFCKPAYSKTESPKDTPADQPRSEFSETLQAIKDFAAEQRGEAVKKAKIALEEVDAAIDGLEERIDRNWEKMDQATRKKARETLKALKKQRNELAEWYGGLKHSSEKAWGHVKGGLLKSYKTLKESFREAEGEYK